MSRFDDLVKKFDLGHVFSRDDIRFLMQEAVDQRMYARQWKNVADSYAAELNVERGGGQINKPGSFSGLSAQAPGQPLVVAQQILNSPQALGPAKPAGLLKAPYCSCGGPIQLRMIPGYAFPVALCMLCNKRQP